MKKKFISLSFPFVLLPVLPIVSCSKTITSNTKANEKEIKYLNEYINDSSYIKNFDMSNLTIDLLKPKEFNMFELLTNNSILNSTFLIKEDSYEKNNQKFSIYYSFDYSIKPDFGTQLKPRLTDKQNKIIIPTNVRIVNNETLVSASTYVDLFTMDILDVIVNNKEDKGFNGQQGKTIQINLKNKNMQFLDIPNQIVNPYINMFLDFDKKSLFQTPVIYEDMLNGKISERWRNKTLQEVYNLNNSIKAPLNLISDKYNPDGLRNDYKYSIESYGFDQTNWEYARFTVRAEVLTSDYKIIKDAKDKYQLDLSLKYSYKDKRWKFKLPNEESIQKAISNNNSIASEISSMATSNKFNLIPKVNLSPREAADKGVDNIVKRFKTANDFLPPKSFTHTILSDDEREVSFEIKNLSPQGTNEIKIEIQINVGSGKLIGKSSYSKTFNIETWQFV